MPDLDKLKHLLNSRHPCITIATQEEAYARQLVAEAVSGMNQRLLVWSVIDGVREGIGPDVSGTAKTEHPAAGMLYLTRQLGQFVALAFDLIEHLKDARTLRVTRELIYNLEQSGNTLILVDHREDLPKPIESYATRFDISLPDEKELEQIVTRTLRDWHKKNPIEVNITRSGLKTIIRNLRGVTRRQVEQAVLTRKT